MADVEWNEAAGADSLGLWVGRDKLDVECSEAQRKSTELLKLVGHKKSADQDRPARRFLGFL